MAVVARLRWAGGCRRFPKEPAGLRADAYNLHKSIGLAVLLLMVARLAWRRVRGNRSFRRCRLASAGCECRCMRPVRGMFVSCVERIPGARDKRLPRENSSAGASGLDRGESGGQGRIQRPSISQ